MKRLALAAVLLSMFAFGCAVPEVRYHKVDNIDQNYIPLALMASRVTIGLPKAATHGSNPVANTIDSTGINNPTSVEYTTLQDEAAITVTPTQALGTIHYMEPQQNLLHKTHITITYFDQVKVPKVVGTEVEDNTVKLINSVGGLVTTLVPLFTFVEPSMAPKQPISVPIVIDFSNPAKFAANSSTCALLDGKNGKDGYCYTYELAAIEGNTHQVASIADSGSAKSARKDDPTVTAEYFFSHYDEKYTNKIPFSSCVGLTLHIKKCTIKNNQCDTADATQQQTFTIVIADPLHVDWLPMPVKGFITLQATCGADSKTETSSNPDAFAILDAVSKQVAAVANKGKNTSAAGAKP